MANLVDTAIAHLRLRGGQMSYKSLAIVLEFGADRKSDRLTRLINQLVNAGYVRVLLYSQPRIHLISTDAPPASTFTPIINMKEELPVPVASDAPEPPGKRDLKAEANLAIDRLVAKGEPFRNSDVIEMADLHLSWFYKQHDLRERVITENRKLQEVLVAQAVPPDANVDIAEADRLRIIQALRKREAQLVRSLHLIEAREKSLQFERQTSLSQLIGIRSALAGEGEEQSVIEALDLGEG